MTLQEATAKLGTNHTVKFNEETISEGKIKTTTHQAHIIDIMRAHFLVRITYMEPGNFGDLVERFCWVPVSRITL